MKQTEKNGLRPGLNTTNLTTSQQRLVMLMRDISFGRIEGLAVAGGEPVFQNGPTVVRDIKFGAGSDSIPINPKQDFSLKAQVIEMFEHLQNMSNGTVEVLEIKNGLPFRMSVKETIEA